MLTDSSDCRLPTARMSEVEVVARALVVSTGTPSERGRCSFLSCAWATCGPASMRANCTAAASAVTPTTSEVAANNHLFTLASSPSPDNAPLAARQWSLSPENCNHRDRFEADQGGPARAPSLQSATQFCPDCAL